MAQFAKGLAFVMKHEGTTLFCDPLTGERSRWGITQALLTKIQYHCTDPDLLKMTEVNCLYRLLFWDVSRLDEVECQLVANKIFDMSVNMGNYTAIRLLQASLNSVGGTCVIDGILGAHTVIVINDFLKRTDNIERLLTELVLKSVQFYRGIAVGPNKKNLVGWISRAEDIGLGEVDKLAFHPLRDGGKDKIIKG